MVADAKGSARSDSPPFSQYGSPRQRPTPPNPSIADISHYIADAKVFAAKYVAAQTARVKGIVRNAILFGILGTVAALISVTVLVYATIMVCAGIAGAIAGLCGGRAWAGNLITGFLVLGTVVITALLMIKRIIKSARRATIAEFERQKLRTAAAVARPRS